MFLWELIVLLLLQICSYFVMREISCCLFLTIIKQLTLPQDNLSNDLLNIDNPFCDLMASQIFPMELQVNKSNSSDTEISFLNVDLSITNAIVSTLNYNKRDNLIWKQLVFHFLMEMFLAVHPMALSFLVCIHFALYSFGKSMFKC